MEILLLLIIVVIGGILLVKIIKGLWRVLVSPPNPTQQWNWGAFWWGGIYYLVHKMYVGATIIIIISIIVGVFSYYGIGIFVYEIIGYAVCSTFAAIYANKNAKKKYDEEEYEKTIVKGVTFAQELIKANNLYTCKLFTEAEYIERKRKILTDFESKIIDSDSETFLNEITILIQKNILNQDEINLIKKKLFVENKYCNDI